MHPITQKVNPRAPILGIETSLPYKRSHLAKVLILAQAPPECYSNENTILNFYIVNMKWTRDIFKKKTSTEILIKHGRLIDPVFIFYCQHNPDLKKRGWNDWIPPSKEELDRRIRAYREEWRKYNVVEDISKTLGLSFKRDVIDVFIVSGISRASSHPIIIKSGFKPKEFVVTLAHELIHVILTDNKIKKIVFNEKESETTNNHVIVYAVLKKILDQELWKIASTPSSKYPSEEYEKAKMLAEQIGPNRVVKMMMSQ